MRNKNQLNSIGFNNILVNNVFFWNSQKNCNKLLTAMLAIVINNIFCTFDESRKKQSDKKNRRTIISVYKKTDTL